jgi:hypothetical protein
MLAETYKYLDLVAEVALSHANCWSVHMTSTASALNACRDIAPEGATLAETNKTLDLVAEVLMMIPNLICMPVFTVVCFHFFYRVQGHCP